MITTHCRICGSCDNNRVHVAREMMFGWRDKFEYVECSSCGCLQIATIPNDSSKYYPPGYYSFGSARPVPRRSFAKSLLKKKRLDYWLTGRGVLGGLLTRAYGEPELHQWLRDVGLRAHFSILDVGCGSGSLLLHLYLQGFRHLIGVDPFIDKDISYENGVKILRGTVLDVQGPVDFIMANHSFEHMAEPLAAVKAMHRILRPGRFLLISTPTVSSFAWRRYGVNWVQLDAPRHLHIHSIKSMQLLAEESGFELVRVAFESTSLQFLGSEQYERDIPLMDAKSYKRGLADSIFTVEDVARFEARAKELNESGEGDSARFLLKKK